MVFQGTPKCLQTNSSVRQPPGTHTVITRFRFYLLFPFIHTLYAIKPTGFARYDSARSWRFKSSTILYVSTDKVTDVSEQRIAFIFRVKQSIQSDLPGLGWTAWPWRWRNYAPLKLCSYLPCNRVPSKHRHGSTLQKPWIFTNTAVRTSNTENV